MTQTLITAVPDYKAFARASDEEAATLAKDSNSEVFGKDGLSFGDVLDAINPLNHIPVVSDIYSSLTGEKASAGSRLIGGTLFGGPIGAAISIASLLFEEGTGGKSPVEAVVAALTEETSTTQLAQVEPETPAVPNRQNEDASALAAAAPVVPVELASLALTSDAVSHIPIRDAANTTRVETSTYASETLLDLYGASAASAHGSYQKAQMLPYLRDVTVSKTL